MNALSLSSNFGRILPVKIHAETENQKKLLQAAQALEATFAKDLLAPMGEKLPGTPGGLGGNIFGDMMKNAIADELAKSEALGLSRQIYNDTKKLADKQEIDAAARRNLATKNF